MSILVFHLLETRSLMYIRLAGSHGGWGSHGGVGEEECSITDMHYSDQHRLWGPELRSSLLHGK